MVFLTYWCYSNNNCATVQDPEAKVAPMLTWLGSLGLTQDQVRTVAIRQPRLLSFTVARVQAQARALQEEAGLTDAELARVVLWAPQNRRRCCSPFSLSFFFLILFLGLLENLFVSLEHPLPMPFFF
jgi:hypothetical protein